MADRQRGEPAVLVVPPSSAACVEGISAFVDGRAEVVLRSDELRLLPDAMAAVSSGFGVVSTRVVDGVRGVPSLTDDERAVLALVVEGRTNEAIAAVLGCSVSSVKRDIARLCRRFDVRGRAALIDVGRASAGEN